MSIELRGLHEALRPWAEYAVALGRYYGLNPRITSVRRSWAEQQALYDRYQASLSAGTFRKPGGVQYPAAPPGRSAHAWGLAWDSVVPADQQQLWNRIREYAGFRVLSNDIIHAEFPAWRQVVGLG